ncbi:Coiled-coil domain-containing protein 111 [Habropoda laboriosa]|uniref:DNA-directed primase/polymerase protein n=1 Tax=Habropoda laboriosa TaxID=597456 RepID=A0A0L7QKW3_9HYME|nr:PREDICTED: DNA-directed primase/polymerase protein-like [Habropoda laboriosa]KOC59166.1 Coiled-coil domain-containing protein 111 [Habropoda laboriosa]
MNSLDAEKFYGKTTLAKLEIVEKKVNSKQQWVKVSRRMPSCIMGPPEFWMEFCKQAEALRMAGEKSTDFQMLSTFVYQRDNGYRKFVVAHPERYWWHYEHRPAEERCSYEIIPECHPCRLYLDLEYSIELNSKSDGPSMTDTIINVFSSYLLAYWHIPCNKYNVVNLDSSTDEKFSRHLIFNVKNVAFKDNYHVGRLVKSVCQDILDYVSLDVKSHDILCNFEKAKLERLIVETKKGKGLFVDTAVYTKNRHFRIYKSTKWGKKSNLIISDDSKYIPTILSKDKELNIFLDSLITYFFAKKDLMLLECAENGALVTKPFKREIERNRCFQHDYSYSSHSILDKYISNLIYPGKVRACKYRRSSNLSVYQTSGYRYCENIGRCHKSNNVFWVVDLKNKTMYQKCQDQDCFGFKPKRRRLPEEICFQIDEDDDILLRCALVTEDIAQKAGSF